ncbi:MAG: NAD-glutamate dehydrogenase [Oceanospirillales bacterium]|nr:NAD-glutamate dehydrogenase [Oceanospirillales bacterium]
MTFFSSPTKATVFEQLASALRARLPEADAEWVIRFAHQLYAVSSSSDLLDTGIDQLCASVQYYWRAIQRYTGEGPHVEVFNPTLTEHGWHSPRTAVMVHSQDMPFIVDSIRMELARMKLTVRSVNNCTPYVERADDGTLLALPESRVGGRLESALFIEIDRVPDPGQLMMIRESLREVMAEVEVTVADYQPMLDKLDAVRAELEKRGHDCAQESEQRQTLVEAGQFLHWLGQRHFVLLGYEKLSRQVAADSDHPLTEGWLGVQRSRAEREQVGEAQRLMNESDAPISLLKDSRRSRVFRADYQDLVLVRQFNDRGQVIGAHCFFGLYTSSVYQTLPTDIPMVRHKVNRILDASGFEPGGHSYKQILYVLKDLPRSELLLASVPDLQTIVMGVFNLQERRKACLFTRRSEDGLYYSCLYYAPRDIYNTALRVRVQEILEAGFGAKDVEVSAQLSTSVLFRTHFVLYVDPLAQFQCDLAQIEADVLAVSRSWDDDLLDSLIAQYGEEQGIRLSQRYRGAFPTAYREHFSPQHAVADIEQIEVMGEGGDVPLSFYPFVSEDAHQLRFKLYNQQSSVVLSDVIPMLENLGMRVLGEHPHVVERQDGVRIWISDFVVTCQAAGGQSAERIEPLLREAFKHIWNGQAENDPFNHLILGAGLGWREVALLRAYARYMKQLRFGFSQPFIAAALGRHLGITRQLVEYFDARFKPGYSDGERDTRAAALTERITSGLDEVETLDDDRILRRFFVLIGATLRTNYYQHCNEGEHKRYFSFKLDPAAIPDIPQPRPRFEIFVYSPRIEGVHLRAGPIARGGLRWSDRVEDYRTEVLGLVKAQQVKNSVIVPVGAKGCFICKQPPEGGRDAFIAEGIACYKDFIRGMLDITDNLKGGEVVPPKEVVRHDSDDPYLVVAADKGTATFSDIANAIAEDYGFWLGDAFASGGSEGYDHKKMGITARGAWESVKRHFQELGVDTQTQPFTVVGIGDMAGDVFGNGMLCSDQIHLVGAFNHQHIFIDPTPDAARSFAERKRLFELPRSSWADYDVSLISEGGGVFPRAAKWIPISPQMRQVLQIEAERLAPNDLIKALLMAPVDLLWNGGIGTYVKARQESHEEVGDKSNDGLRINGEQLRCKVLGEGGNLGVTQRGRIEFALNGGAANTDFIDNAGGVDCSDHEVNIKILLNELVQVGKLSLEERNHILRDMTDEVAQLVLKNNYRQALALSIAQTDGVAGLDDYARFIRRLEADGKLNRQLEFLPDEETLQQRQVKGIGLTRPELSVLISYAKIELKQTLVDAWIARDSRFAKAFNGAFPASLLAHFSDDATGHRLRAEITATQIANDLVNRMGITYVNKMKRAAGTGYADVAAAYLIIREVYDVDRYWRDVEALDGRVATEVQVALLRDLVGLISRGSHWLLQYRRGSLDPALSVARYRDALTAVTASAEQLKRVIPEDRWCQRYDYYIANGVPESLALYCASTESRYWLMDIIEVALQLDQSLERVAKVYFTLGEELNLIWLDRQIRAFRPVNHWELMAALSFRNELDHHLRELTAGVFVINDAANEMLDPPEKLVERWWGEKRAILKRWKQTLTDMQASKEVDCAVFSVAGGVLKELAIGKG